MLSTAPVQDPPAWLLEPSIHGPGVSAQAKECGCHFPLSKFNQ